MLNSGCSAGVAHRVRDARVGGSNPLTPKNIIDILYAQNIGF